MKRASTERKRRKADRMSAAWAADGTPPVASEAGRSIRQEAKSRRPNQL